MLPLATVAAAALAAAAAQPGRYDPVADPAAVVVCSATQRLTVLTPKIVRVEAVPDAGAAFEDRATLSFVNRRLPVPHFTVRNTSAWCNVSVTAGVEVALRKAAAGPPPAPPPPPESSCDRAREGTDARCSGTCERVVPVAKSTQPECCAACDANARCGTWVFDTDKGLCYLLAQGTVVATKNATARTLGGATGADTPPRPDSLRAPGVLQASSAPGAASPWSWRAWEAEDPESNPAAQNLLGTLKGTPSADLAGCCTNPNATAGEYDTKDPYVLQPGLLSRAGCTAIDDSDTPLYDITNVRPPSPRLLGHHPACRP